MNAARDSGLNERCECGHLQAAHGALMMGDLLVDRGHGGCGQPGCPCGKYRWAGSVDDERLVLRDGRFPAGALP